MPTRRDDSAEQAGAHRRVAPQPGANPLAARDREGDEGHDQGQEDEDDRAGEAVPRELQAALGDVAEVAQPTGVEAPSG